MATNAAQLATIRQANQAKATQAAANRAAAHNARVAANKANHDAAVAAHNAAHAARLQQIYNKHHPSVPDNGTTDGPTTVVQPGTGLASPDQSVVSGGYVGTNIGTNDTGGITLGNGTGDTTTPPSTGLTTTEYIAIGAVLLLVVFFVVRHHNG